MTPDQYRREGFRLGIETAARLVSDDAGVPVDGYFIGNRDRSAKERATMIRAIDVDAVLAGLPPVTGGQSAVKVCPICDIAGCRHIRDAASAPDPVARLMKAARALADHGALQDREYLSADLDEKLDALRAALEAMEKPQ